VTVYLADTSIWVARRRSADLAERLVERYLRGVIATCAVIELEGLAGAPDAAAYAADRDVVWRPLTRLPIDEAVCSRALAVQALLAGEGGHAARPLDFLVAACAELAGATLWHCELHLAAICAATGQTQEHELAAVTDA
jgi:predicted nucleic acid-binding protein